MATWTHDLTYTELNLIATSMRCAADKYDENAKIVEEAGKERCDRFSALAAIFTQQAKDTRALAELFEQSETAQLKGEKET